MKTVLRRFVFYCAPILVLSSAAVLPLGCGNSPSGNSSTFVGAQARMSESPPPADMAAGKGIAPGGYGGPAGGFGGPGGAPPPGGGVSGETAVSNQPTPVATGAATAPPMTPAIPRRIIYTATVELVVKDMSEAARKLARRVREMGGYVSGASLTGSEGTPRSGNWTIRLPVSRFEAFMNGVTDFGILESSNTASQDVSEEFYDIEARLRNKRAEEARLLEHLRRSTAKLSDILAVEREISRVREEIERMEGRLRFLANQTDLTTITVSMREERDYVPARAATFGEKARAAFRDSRQALGAFLQGVALVIITLIPWLAIAALVLIPLRVVQRRSSGSGGGGKVISFRPRRRGMGENAPDADRDRYD